ncbi:MAG: translation initiation factor IF-3 [Candidatus Spechtbacteria bacterium RIFCSPHIGHO2_02_FULL_43_15b]|uniref:Translation initiation factor IF-3 n=1 Tax=Candidatus Spechtbacteria bacterium RIFCSPHIGHO2_01_FULL_43_30 TaxID=1802158 RepID=A0A1G2H646_9BACT|nr:MAG: translation initiation factor IF-3 [Candidatus Spechtbacteria bacterium RIFCSPHIGHO2_01_FULL_43_30]OGZ58607.1 MAG: translation initiation factor IF-3 [Candidatus Spechtbacteria bacterium RIFCSPHIGHO2_02_FULL_43_15b]
MQRRYNSYNRTPVRRNRINEEIQARELRVIDNEGNNLGILSIEEALRVKNEKGLDLIEISPTAKPPVAKIMEYGKYLYQQQKKDKEGRKGQKNEVKGIRFTVRTSENDLLMRAEQVDKFLKKRYKVRIQMIMKGREKALSDFANQKLEKFLSLIKEPYKTDQEPKRFPMGIFMMISRK